MGFAKSVNCIIKIADFNLSSIFDKNQSDRLQNSEGTVYFYAPEMCSEG